MDNPVVRMILAIAGGLAVAIAVVALVEMTGHALFPSPAGLDLSRAEDQAVLMERTPVAAKIAVVLAWFLGSLAGALAAIAISRRVMPAWIVGLTIAGLSLFTSQMFPHPAWMVVAAVVLPMLGVVLAKHVLRSRVQDT